MRDDSTWKKEISFVRPSEEQAREADESGTPFWKTEISFARRAKRDDGAEETAAPEADPEEPIDEELTWMRAPTFGQNGESQAPIDHASRVPGTVPETGLDEPDPEPAPVVELPVAAAPVGAEPETDEEEPVDEDESAEGPDPETDSEEPAEEEPVWMRAVTFGSKAESQAPTDDGARVEPAPVVEAPAAAAPVESGPSASIDDSSPVQGTVPETGLDEPGPESQLEPEDPTTESWSTLPWLPQELAPSAESEPEPALLHASKKRSVPLLVAGCTGLVVVAVLGALFVIGSVKVASAKRHVNDLNRQLAALAPPSAERQRLPGEQRAHVTALATALAARVSWDRVFRDVSLALPKDVRLTSLTAGTAPPRFTIRGRTPWYQSLDSLVAGLRGESDLRNVQLVGSTRSKVGSRQVLEFTIAADIASPTEGGS